jgi:deoxyinosine 3'endonuclease (endonuclease V)
MARNALDACLINSALLVLVTINGGGICARSGCGIASFFA